MKSCEARYEQGEQQHVVCPITFASGLRSEYCNHPWSNPSRVPAVNWLQWRIRNSTSKGSWNSLWWLSGHHARLFILELASWRILSNQNVTRFRLLFVCRVFSNNLIVKVRGAFHLLCKSATSYDESFAFHIRSFHSSTLPSGETPPVRDALHSPLNNLAEPKSIRQVWATKLVRWAESGGRCCERSLKWPSFGCLSSFSFLCLYDKSLGHLLTTCLFPRNLLIIEGWGLNVCCYYKWMNDLYIYGVLIF